MSADMHIHVFEGITEHEFAVFHHSHLGSKYGLMLTAEMTREEVAATIEKHWCSQPTDEERRAALDKIAETPNIWVGEVSWLKAGLFDDPETYVPSAIGQINALIGEDLPVLDEALKAKILAALLADNSTRYMVAREKDNVAKFLDQHMGKRLFTVSW